MTAKTTPKTTPAPTDDELVARALDARKSAYAPYSGYRVGAAVEADGEVFPGANVENASFGLCICAERNAVSAAVLAGKRRLDRVAVASDSDPPAAPCGMCRQTLLEFCDDPALVRVIMVNPAGDRAETTLADLVPLPFDRSKLIP